MTTKNDTVNDPAGMPITQEEAFLDAAIARALTADSPEEAAAFSAALAVAGEDRQAAARDVHETAARLSAASPFMRPSAHLRGAILAATAPVAFKMEDYRRKADQVSPWYLRIGFAAAVVFLVAGAWWNMAVKQQLATANDQIKKLATAANALHVETTDQGQALAMLLDPKVQHLPLNVNSGTFKGTGTLLLNPDTNAALVLLPQTVLPPGSQATMTIEQNGVEQKIVATAVGAPNESAWMNVPLKSGIDHQKPVRIGLNDQPTVAQSH